MATVTHRNATTSTLNTTSYATTSFTPVAGELLAFVAIVGASVEDLGQFIGTANANGITFARIGAWERGGIDTMCLFVANQLVPASPVAMTCAVGTSDAGTGCIEFVTGISGMTKTGALAVKQFNANNGAGGGTPSAEFGAAPTAGNPQIGYLQNVSNPANVTSPSGWANAADVGYTQPAKGGRYSYLEAGNTTATVTWGSTSASAWAVMIAEFDTSDAAGPGNGDAAGSWATTGTAVGRTPWLQLQREGSFENLTETWVAGNSGVLTFPTPGDAPHGTHVARLTEGGGANPYFTAAEPSALLIPVAPEQEGQYLTAYAEYRWVGPNTPNATTRFNVYFLDETESTITSHIGTPFAPSTSWTRTQNNDNQIPAGTVWASLRPIINNAVSGDALEVDQLYATIGANIPAVGPHPPWTPHALDTAAVPSGSATGTWTVTGVASGSKEPAGVASGTWTFTGTATGSKEPAGSATGSWATNGTAVGSKEPAGTASGTIAYVGAAVGTRHSEASATGTVAWAGAGTGHAPDLDVNSGTATGTTTWTGAATGNAPPNIGDADGTWTFTGTAVGHHDPTATSSGAVTWVGMAVGNVPSNSGTATGTHTWTAVAVGHRDPAGTGVGSLVWAGVATGSKDPAGIASGTVSWVGSAFATSTPLGTATGTWATNGTASGSKDPAGTATGTTTWTGAGTGHAPTVGVNSGSGMGSVTWVGAASAVNDKSGTASGTLAWVGVAVGGSDRAGTASGTHTWVGAATGSREPSGTATGVATWVGVSIGSKDPTGTATGSVAWVGVTSSLSERHGTATGTLLWFGAGVGRSLFRDLDAGMPLSLRYAATTPADPTLNSGPVPVGLYSDSARPPRYRSGV